MKRPVLLIDDPKLRGWTGALNVVRSLAPLAQRFVFDETASEKVGEVILSAGPQIIKNRKFARPSFPVMYVEFDSGAMLRKMNPPNHKEHVDVTIGYLFETPPDGNTKVHTIVRQDNISMIAPITYVLDQSPLPNDIRVDGYIKVWRSDGTIGDVAMSDREVRACVALGSSSKTVDTQTAFEIANEYRIIPYNKDAKKVLNELCGDLRNMWTLLTLINAPTREHIVDLQPVPRFVGMVGNKRRIIPAYRNVTVNLDGPRSVASSLGLSEHTSPRWHSVRGHYVHLGLDPACKHVWKAVECPDKVSRCICINCGGRRTWRTLPNGRGDINKGRVDHDYIAR